jgi:hypothetical protein
MRIDCAFEPGDYLQVIKTDTDSLGITVAQRGNNSAAAYMELSLNGARLLAQELITFIRSHPDVAPYEDASAEPTR